MKPALKIVANLLGALGVLVAFVNPKAVFAVEQPVSFLFLCGAVLLGLVAYFLPAKSASPLNRFPDLAVVGATLVLIAFALTRFSPVRYQLILAEHLGAIPYLGMGDRADVYRPAYGPKLLRSEKVMAFHEGLLREYRDVETVLKDHGRYALVYAGRRLRGQSDDQIFADPFGPRLFLGTLVSETFEPYWLGTMTWLQKELPMKPSADWKMGLLPPDWAKAKFQQIASNPATVDAQKADASMIEGLLYIALRRPGFATPQQTAAILDAWAEIQKKAGYAIDQPVAAARSLAAGLSASAAVRFEYPATWSEPMRAVFTADLLRFLEAGGVHARQSPDGTPITVSATPREWDNVAYVFTDEQYRTIRGHTASIHLPNGIYIAGRETRTQVLERTTKETRGRLGVPTLILRLRHGAQDAAYGFAPVTLISKQTAESLWSCDPSKPSIGITRETEEQFFADLTLAPWRFGLQIPNEENNRNKRSGESLY